MKIRLLTGQEQLEIFQSSDPIGLMREYISYAEDLWVAAKYKDARIGYKRGHNPEAMLKLMQETKLTERQQECLDHLTSADMSTIYHHKGPVYSGILMKMLDTFPKDVSKELLLQYVSVKYVELGEKVRIKALQVLGKDAKDIILPKLHLTLEIFNQLLKTFSKEEIKEILISMAKGYDSHTEHDNVELKILEVFSNEDLKDILRAFIADSPWMSEQCFLKLFEIFPQEETKELLEIAIKNDMDIGCPTLKKIIKVFPKEDAKFLLDAFFKTSPGCSYYAFEKTEIYKELNKQK